MRLTELLEHWSHTLRAERERASAQGMDNPIAATNGRRLATVGTLHHYAFDLPLGTTIGDDVPMTILPPGNMEPTEGFALGRQHQTVSVQTFDAFGQTVASATLVPDATGFLETVAQRLADMAKDATAYALGPAERLIPWLDPGQVQQGQPARPAGATSVLATNWSEDRAGRRARLAAMAVEIVRHNKRLLLVSPTHQAADEIAGLVARALRGGGLTFKSLLTRYEMPLQEEAAGVRLLDLGFEAQMHQFFAQSRADKAALRRKYERFRELTPLLAYKAEKQRDLDEVKLLEWRLLTQLSDLQAKIKEVEATLAEYEAIPIWKRLAMQTVGKNVASLAQYRALYEQQVKTLMGELEIAQQRILELSPEAAIPKDLRPEYDELKQEIKRLGGTKQIRELLAAEEGTNRQAFIQNKRVVVTTAARVASDPLFSRVRFDVLLADEAPQIPAPLLLAAAGLARERIVLSGDEREIGVSQTWRSAACLAVGQPA